MTKDLRTISSEERDALRERAVMEIGNCKNISKVSRDLGINRQVLYSWLNKRRGLTGFHKDKRGRPKQDINENESHQILEVLSHNLPLDLGIDSIFWSVSSVRKSINNTLGINLSAYLIRRWLLDKGFFNSRTTAILGISSVATKGLPVQEFAEQCNMPCYIYWRTAIYISKGWYDFHCIGSSRGDIRFVRFGIRQTSVFLNKLQEVAKRNIVVVCGEYCRLYQYDLIDISESITMFRLGRGNKLKSLCSPQSRTSQRMQEFIF